MDGILCGGLLAALVSTPGAALEVVLQEGRDGYSGTDDSLLYAPSSVAEINYGVAPSAGAGVNRWNEHLVVLVRFALTDLPAGAKVTGARLELHQKAGIYPYRDIVLEAAPLTAANAAWAEGQNDGTRVPVPGAVCWSWLAQGQARWEGEPGLRRSGYLADLASRAPVAATAEQWTAFDVPAELLQGWLDAAETNGGWRLYPAGESLVKGDSASVVLSEYEDDASLRPKLVLQLADQPGLAEELERRGQVRVVDGLEGDVSRYRAEVREAGRPPRAGERLAKLREGLQNCRSLVDAWEPRGAAPEGLADAIGAVTSSLTEARRMLASDIAAAANEERGLSTDFALGVATSMEKVFRRDVPFTGPYVDTLRIAAAGNEHEAGQVVVVPVDQDLEQVTWSLKPLSNIRLTVAPVGYVKSDTPQLVTQRAPSEWWPDPLLDFLDTFDCPRGEVQPLWVSAYVPPGTRAGVYQTVLTVNAKGAELKRVAIEVRVFGFDVPHEQHLKTIWGMNEANFARFYGEDYDEELAWRYFDLFLDHRMAPADLYRSKPNGVQDEDSVYHLASVEALRKLWERGSRWWNVGYVLAPKHVVGEGEGKYATYEEYLTSCVAMFREELARVREAGWPDGHYAIYFLDETSNFEALAQAAKAMRDNFPGVPLMTTGYDRSYGVDKESPVADALDIWVPLTPRYHEDWEKIREGRELGKQAWWYICVGPRGKADLNWFVQYPAIRARLLMGAATWNYQPDGFLYYRTAGWIYHDGPITSGPMTDWLPRYHPGLPDGDGQIICAGPDGPLSTIRLENIRDGIEDYEYWWVLRALAADSPLLEVPEELLTDIRQYSEAPQALYDTRRRVAEAIEGMVAQ